METGAGSVRGECGKGIVVSWGELFAGLGEEEGGQEGCKIGTEWLL